MQGKTGVSFKRKLFFLNYCKDSLFWEGLNTTESFFDEIGRFLPLNRSWSKDIIMFGTEKSNRVELFLEKGMVVSVEARIDFTSEYELVLNQLIEFCILKCLTILGESLNELPLNFLSINSLIQSAPQVLKYNELAEKR